MRNLQRENEIVGPFCHMPVKINRDDSEVYDLMLSAHCADKDNPGHVKCIGTVSISTDALVVRCKRCGDAKAVRSEAKKATNA